MDDNGNGNGDADDDDDHCTKFSKQIIINLTKGNNGGIFIIIFFLSKNIFLCIEINF